MWKSKKLIEEAVDKEVDSPQRKGRVCAGNPRRVSCAIEILSFQNFYKVLKTGSAGRKDFFDTLKARSSERAFPFYSSSRNRAALSMAAAAFLMGNI